MIDPRQIAVGIVGEIDWLNEVSGFCRCPGEAFHTHKTGKKDCRINVDGAPTIHCFHASCVSAVVEANLQLRRALSVGDWSITLPGGNVLRSGDVLQHDGSVQPKEVVTLSKNQIASWNSAKQKEFLSSIHYAEEMILESLKVAVERFRSQVFREFRWPFENIVTSSPLQVSERDPEDQFRTWLKLWPAHCHVWIGDVFSSGKPEHRTHFRPVSEWYQIGPVMGNFTCGSAFKPGSFQRSNENLDGHRFMVIESDTLSKDQVGAVFLYLRRRLKYRLHCIIDTGGKSLHAWFDAPRNKVVEERLKTGLTVLGCDPKVFTYSQPVRVPGAWRDGKLQKLIWFADGHR